MKIYIVFEDDYDTGYEVYSGKAFLNKDNAETFVRRTLTGDVFEYEVEDSGENHVAYA